MTNSFSIENYNFGGRFLNNSDAVPFAFNLQSGQRNPEAERCETLNPYVSFEENTFAAQFLSTLKNRIGETKEGLYSFYEKRFKACGCGVYLVPVQNVLNYIQQNQNDLEKLYNARFILNVKNELNGYVASGKCAINAGSILGVTGTAPSPVIALPAKPASSVRDNVGAGRVRIKIRS